MVKGCLLVILDDNVGPLFEPVYLTLEAVAVEVDVQLKERLLVSH